MQTIRSDKIDGLPCIALMECIPKNFWRKKTTILFILVGFFINRAVFTCDFGCSLSLNYFYFHSPRFGEGQKEMKSEIKSL